MSYFRSLAAIVAIPIGIIALFFLCWLLAAGCSRAHIIVTNHSSTVVSNLVISGSCKERHSDILAAESVWRTATPYHEGEIWFSFDSAGMSYRTNVAVHYAFLGLIYTISTNMLFRVETRG